MQLAHGISAAFHKGVHIYTANRYWVTPKFLGSRYYMPMAFTTKSPLAQCLQHIVIYDAVCKNKENTKHRFEVGTDSSIKARQHFLSARGKSARYAREFSFARCHDATGAIILHGSASVKRCTTRIRPDGQHPQQEVQNRNLQQVCIVWSGKYKNGGVLSAARPCLGGMVDV